MLLLAFVALYTLIHPASWANVPYRLPIDAVLVAFAASGIADLADRFAARRRAISTSRRALP